MQNTKLNSSGSQESKKDIGLTWRSVEGDVFGPSGLVNVRVYEMLRTFTPLESVSSGHDDSITSAQQPYSLFMNQLVIIITACGNSSYRLCRWAISKMTSCQNQF